MPSRLVEESAFAATDDSKKPNIEIMKEVLIAVLTCLSWPQTKGH
jgi:hypothetical protein